MTSVSASLRPASGRALDLFACEPRLHGLGERGEAAEGADVDGHLLNPALRVEAQQVDAVELAIADRGGEGEYCCAVSLGLVGVAKVLEDRGDRRQEHRDSSTTLVGAEHRRAAEDGALGE